MLYYGKRSMATEVKHSHTLLFYSCLSVTVAILLLGSILLWEGFSPEPKYTTLKIRPLQPSQNTPDGFFVLHKLDQYNIQFNSITLKNNILLITFNSPEQSETAKEVLSPILPHGFVIEHDNNSNRNVH